MAAWDGLHSQGQRNAGSTCICWNFIIWGAYFCMAAHKRDVVVVIKIGAIFMECLNFVWVLIIPTLRYAYNVHDWCRQHNLLNHSTRPTHTLNILNQNHPTFWLWILQLQPDCKIFMVAVLKGTCQTLKGWWRMVGRCPFQPLAQHLSEVSGYSFWNKQWIPFYCSEFKV